MSIISKRQRKMTFRVNTFCGKLSFSTVYSRGNPACLFFFQALNFDLCMSSAFKASHACHLDTCSDAFVGCFAGWHYRRCGLLRLNWMTVHFIEKGVNSSCLYNICCCKHSSLKPRSAVRLQKADWEIVRASVLETQLTTDAAEASTTLRICKLL